jgi:hypothetical protein
MGDGIIVAFVVMIIATTIYKIIELKHRDRGSSEEFSHQLATELADRDDCARALEERIRVLEKIITDKHSSYALSEEIEQLKEVANER